MATQIVSVTVAVALSYEAIATESQAEVQINLCSPPAQVIRALQLAEKGKPTTVWLFDSPTLTLHHQGIRLRLREQGKAAELTLKVAGQDCATVDNAQLQPNGKCEADLHGDTLDDVVSLTRRLDAQARSTLLTPNGSLLAAALARALEPRQRRMLAAKQGVEGSAVMPEDIARLGPATVRAYRGPSSPTVAEVWTLPGGQQFVELSERTRRDAALARRAELARDVTAAGIAICPDQDSQAKSKLEMLVR